MQDSIWVEKIKAAIYETEPEAGMYIGAYQDMVKRRVGVRTYDKHKFIRYFVEIWGKKDSDSRKSGTGNSPDHIK